MNTSMKSIKGMRTIFFAVVAVLFSFGNLFAQGDTATLRGTVLDQNGAIIAGAKVTVANEAKALKREVVTNADGNFTVQLLPPETYKVKVEQNGFSTTEVADLKLNANDQRQLRIELTAAGVTATVKIEESAQGVESGGATSTTVSGQLVNRLPLNGRSFQSLLYQVPGVVLAQGDGQISVNGNRTDANYFTLDGVSANVGVGARQANVNIGAYGTQGVADQRATGSVPGFNASGSTAGLISVDALQEFKVQTSAYSAEFGRQPGGQIQMTSKSGQNDYHFTAFEYFRNDALDANDWFSNRGGLKRPPLKQNDFGGTFSGPLYLPRFGEGGPKLYSGKNRTFFFASFEKLKLKQPLPNFIQTVPAKYVRDSAAAFNPVVQALLRAYPLPNGIDVTCSATGLVLPAGIVNPCPTGQTPTSAAQQFIKNNYTLQNTTAFSVRVDHKVNDKWNIFGRVNFAPSDTKSPVVGRVTVTEVNTSTVTLALIGVLSSNVVNDFRFNWSRNEGNGYTAPSNEDGAVPPSLRSLLPNIAPQNSQANPSLANGVFYTLGTFSNNLQRQLNFVDGLTITKGAHSFKFGVDYRRLTPEYAPREYVATYSFASLATMVTGIATPTITSLDRVPLKIENYSAFAQDSWRATNRLTIDYGVRWDVNPAPVGTEKPLYSLTGLGDFTQLGRINAVPSTIALTTGKLYPTKYDAFAPRFGVAYQLIQKSGWETVLRGGIGIYYDLGAGISANAASQYPYLRSRSPGAVQFPLSDLNGGPAPALSVTTPIPASQQFTVIDPAFSLPRSYQWTFSVGQNFLKNYNLTASYVGNQGRRLLRRYSTQLPTTTALNPNFNGAFLNITTNKAGNADSSDYHALQIQLNRRFANNWQFLSNYTWAHAIDTGSDDTTANYFSNGANPKVDRGNSAFDRRHIFNLSLSYESNFKFENKFLRTMLNGWTSDLIFKAQSAAPFSVTYGRALPAQGTGGFNIFPFRADIVAGQAPWIIDATAPGGKRLNPAAFNVGSDISGTRAGLDNPRQGTSTRNGYFGFGATQLDFSMGRQFNLGEGLKLTLRGDMFNISNHPNFASPFAGLGNYFDFGAGTPIPTLSASDPCVTNPATACTTFGRTSSMLNRSFGTSTGAFSPLNQLGGPRSVQLTAKLTF